MKLLLSLVTAGLLFSTVTARSQTYECEIWDPRHAGQIPNVVAFELPAKQSNISVFDTTWYISVFDTITYQSTKQTVLAEVVKNSTTRIQFKWRSGNIVPSIGKKNLAGTLLQPRDYQPAFSATFLRKKKLLLVKAFGNAYAQAFTGRGKCKVSQKRLSSFR